jgi:hypothetical protein
LAEALIANVYDAIGFSEQFRVSSVEVVVCKTIGRGDLEPLIAEASRGSGMKAKFDRNGLKDVVAKARLEANTYTSIKSYKIDIENRFEQISLLIVKVTIKKIKFKKSHILN